MKTVIYKCDRCKKEVNEDELILCKILGENIELCNSCNKKCINMVKQFTNEYYSNIISLISDE